MRRGARTTRLVGAGLLLASLLSWGASPFAATAAAPAAALTAAATPSDSVDDLAAARGVFERNLGAIRRRDRATTRDAARA